MKCINIKLDDALFVECNSPYPDQDKIIDLILDGGNINASIPDDCNILLSVLRWSRSRGVDLEFIRLLIDLGADVNHEVNGFNSLEEALLTFNPELVKLLLESKANPNCISPEDKSMLDFAYQLLSWINDRYEPSAYPNTLKNIALLKKYGAKTLSELASEIRLDYVSY